MQFLKKIDTPQMLVLAYMQRILVIHDKVKIS
jgi:hypothetical protein